MARRTRRILTASSAAHSRVRSFRFVLRGGIQLPTPAEWQSFFHTTQGIGFLFLLLIFNFAYLDFFARPFFVEAVESDGVYISHDAVTALAIDDQYQSALSSLITPYLRQREIFLHTLSSTGILSPDAQATWLSFTTHTRNQLLSISTSSRFKELHISFVSIISMDEEALLSHDTHGDWHATAALFQEETARIDALFSRYPWLLPTVSVIRLDHNL